MIFVVVLILLTSTNLLSVVGADEDEHDVTAAEKKYPECHKNCKKAKFFKLPEGVEDDYGLIHNFDEEGLPDEGRRLADAMRGVRLCGEELNKLSGNKGCPENAVVRCYKGNNAVIMEVPYLFSAEPCLNKTKCVPKPDNKEWERVCK